MFNTRLYRNLPLPLQEKFLSFRSTARNLLRENSVFLDRFLSTIDHTEWMEERQIKTFQCEKIRNLLRFAERSIPYYQELFKRIGFDSRDFGRLRDIEQLPFLTKEIVRENGALLRPRFPRRLLGIAGHTSGTTGTPLAIYQDPAAIMRERAFQRRIARWAGFRLGDRKIWLRGDVIVPITEEVPPFWRYNRAENQLMMSSYHISKKTLPHYIEAIRDFSPDLISAYPSSIFSIAAFLKNNNYEPLNVGSIVTSSETLFEEQKTIIETMFNCRVYNFYGSYERVAAIASCDHQRLHIMEDYGYVELIDSGVGYKELVATGFNNMHMPLLRYKSGDLVEVSRDAHQRCSCGRSFRTVKAILGRRDDYILLPNGRTIQRLDFIFKDDVKISEAQIYQYLDLSVDIKVVPAAGFDEKDEHRILKNARDRLGPEVKISVTPVEGLPRTTSGKFQSIVSEATLNQH